MVSVCSKVTSFWNMTLASIAFGYTVRAPLSNSFVRMRIIVINEVGPTTYLCVMSALMGKSGLVAMRINSSKYKSSSSQTCAFVFAWVRVPIDGIACARTTTSILLNTRAWGSLYTSDELRGLFIVPDLTPLYLIVHFCM